MFYSWSNVNKITTNALQIQYTGAYTKTYHGNRIYEFHRLATKEYSYVGMTEAAAKACQDAKLAQYTRKFVQWYNENGYWSKMRQFKCVANVTMNSDGDGLWSVDISVSEDQLQYNAAIDVTSIPYQLFDLSLDYDEDPPEGSYFRATSFWLQGQQLRISYIQGIDGFDRANIVGENSVNGGVTWTTMTPTTISDSEVHFNSGVWQEGLVRLRYGTTAIVTNYSKTPEHVYTRNIDLYSQYWQVVGGVGGAWRAQFYQDFPNFDSTELKIETKLAEGDEWTQIQDQCDVFGDRITTPYSDQSTMFWMRIYYDGVTSVTVNNLYNFLVVDSNLDITTEYNQVTIVKMTFENKLGEDFDTTKVSVRFKDALRTKTFSGNQLTLVEGENNMWTATIDVGDSIVESPMTCYGTLRYGNSDVTTISKKVYRE